MPSSTHSSDLHLPSSSTSSPVSLSLNHALPIKLDRNNYILWKTQMENVVYANGFEEYIDDTKPCPPQELHTGELNPDFVQWRRFDRMVLSWLYSTLTPDIMGQIVGFQTSHDAWMALHKIFSASSKARILQLRLEFQTAKKGADPMLEYILKIKTISDNLAAIGEPVKETDHILQLLGGLGSEYNSIVASLTAREDDLSLHSVHSILLTHEQRLNHQHTSSADLPFAAAHIAAAPSTQHPRPHHPRFQSPQPRFQSHYSGNHQHVPFSHTRPHNRPHNRPANRSSSSAPHRPPHLPTRLNANCVVNLDIPFTNHQDSWFFDTGATHHLSHSAQTLSNVQPYSGADQVTIGDGHSLPILNTDQVTKQTLLKGWLRDGLYEFPSSSSTHAFVSTSSVSALTPGAIWHSRLGHPATPILSKALASCNPSVSFQINKIAPCKICPLAKSHSLPYSLSSSHASQPLALIHTDLWGPAPSPSTSGARYFLLFIDDYSKYTWIYFLSTKDQALSTFITFRKMIENQLNSTIKCIQSDNGGEFIAFKPYLEAHGIVHQFSCPHTPNKMVGQKGKSVILLKQAWPFWLKASYLQSIGHLPFKHQSISSISYQLNSSIFNLLYKSTACVFLGYASAHKVNTCSFTLTTAHSSHVCLNKSTPLIYIFTSTMSFPVPTSSTNCTSTSDSLPPLLQVPFAPTPSPTPSSSPSPSTPTL
ncbi:Retrovirus-related Pol polyprotein from transposon RE1 [Vitis vinifera]|uniref:Retrovirus-related Pol polyprotein from transposon RE1 n=1 Tax=Vitis vinifera TaxID=29760 RepID=A0A438H6V5_VITVI|nr:Retrovirus-related Pol polyprotein from transposon RE1 [Vitis vinifera]